MSPWRALVPLSLSLVLFGCSGQPAPSGSTSATSGASSIAQRTPDAAADGISVTTPSEPSGDLPVSTVPGIQVEAINREGQPRVRVAWPAIPGADELTAQLSRSAQDEVARFEDRYQPGGLAVPSLNKSWALVLAGGTFVGVRTRTDEFAGASEGHTYTTTFSERGTSSIWSGPDLINDSQRSALVQAIAQKVDREAPTDPQDLAAVLSAASPTAGGGLRLIVPGGVLGPYSDPTREVTLTPEAARPFLSGTGKRLAEAISQSYAAASPSATASPQTPTATGESGSGVDCSRVSCVALTFDDGPGPYTGKLLDELKSANVKATFFQLGSNLAAYPQVEARMKADGHVIANHTWDHQDLTAIGPQAATRQLERTSEALAAATGSRPTLMRPPYGAINASTPVAGMSVILWDIDTQDWKNRDVAATTQRALTASRGSIILMHDIHPSTVKAVPGIIAGLRAKGLTPVTVPELLGKVTPGQRYFRAPAVN